MRLFTFVYDSGRPGSCSQTRGVYKRLFTCLFTSPLAQPPNKPLPLPWPERRGGVERTIGWRGACAEPGGSGNSGGGSSSVRSRGSCSSVPGRGSEEEPAPAVAAHCWARAEGATACAASSHSRRYALLSASICASTSSCWDGVMTGKCYSALSCCGTLHTDQAKGTQTSAPHLYTWAVALETAGDDGSLGQSHNDPS